MTYNSNTAHIFYQRADFKRELDKNDIHLQAWSPLAAGKNGIFENDILKQIAKTHNKTPAQIALKFLVQRGISVIPKASSTKRLQENLNLFDFNLSSEQMAQIAKLDTNKSLFGWDS